MNKTMKKGFTLVEMLISLSIVSILSGIAFKVGFVASAKAKSLANYETLLKSAQEEAMKTLTEKAEKGFIKDQEYTIKENYTVKIKSDLQCSNSENAFEVEIFSKDLDLENYTEETEDCEKKDLTEIAYINSCDFKATMKKVCKV